MATEHGRPLALLRVALLVQGLGGLAIIALTVPDWIDAQVRPLVCSGWCFDFRGLAFVLSAMFIGPVAVLLLMLSWRWRGPRRWPLAIVALIDVAAIFLAVDAMISVTYRSNSVPPVASVPLLLLLPSLATVVLGINLMRPVRWKPILGACAVGCVLLAASLWFYTRSAQQSIPGELPLPFGKTVVYAGRDLGCWDHVQGWVDEHTCTREALLVYRGSGDPAKDQQTINQILVAQQRIQPADATVAPLPVDMAVNKTYSRDVDPANAGLCLMIIDRETTTPPKAQRLSCGSSSAYADIHSHWPGSATYAIGIVYVWDRPDYVTDHSVTFLNAVSGRPGQPATVRVHADPNTRCSIVVVDPSGRTLFTGLGPKTTDASGHVDWTWSVDPSTPPGSGSITVACGSSSGQIGWYLFAPPA